MKKKYILYGTSACHLCEDAEKLINSTIQDMHIIYAKIDITENDNLLQKYGLKIPVFQCLSTKQDLNWPFNEVALELFIEAQ
jgi:predicted DCC family thiol-disulfide oxidoreductase YuxK